MRCQASYSVPVTGLVYITLVSYQYLLHWVGESFPESICKSEFLAHNIYTHGKCKPYTLGKSMKANSGFTLTIVTCFLAFVFALWLSVILLCTGDVHPNPGPSSTSSDDSSSGSSSMSDTIFNSLILHHKLPSFITMFKDLVLSLGFYMLNYFSFYGNVAWLYRYT